MIYVIHEHVVLIPHTIDFVDITGFVLFFIFKSFHVSAKFHDVVSLKVYNNLMRFFSEKEKHPFHDRVDKNKRKFV